MKKFLVTALAVAALAWSTPAKAAEPILFDPDGAGGIGATQALTFDWSVGNTLLVESSATTGTIYFQANLNSTFVTSGTDTFNNGAGGNYFTAVAGFGVNISQTITAGGSLITEFTLDLSNPTNFFNIYHNSAPADDLTGICFVCGNVVLSGKAEDATFSGFNGNYTVPDILNQSNPANPHPDLDQFSGDNYVGIDTITGTGATNIKVTVKSFDAAYFPTLTVNTSFVQSNASEITPFDQTNPSACFDADGLFSAGNDADCTDAGDIIGAPGVGPINGISTNKTVTQTDANSSFEAPAIVPEPTTLSLLGLGLLVGGAHLRRRAKKSA
jgi:opacity protein-like surface antigen